MEFLVGFREFLEVILVGYGGVKVGVVGVIWEVFVEVFGDWGFDKVGRRVWVYFVVLLVRGLGVVVL